MQFCFVTVVCRQFEAFIIYHIMFNINRYGLYFLWFTSRATYYKLNINIDVPSFIFLRVIYIIYVPSSFTYMFFLTFFRQILTLVEKSENKCSSR
jgi:hypothetical protein